MNNTRIVFFGTPEFARRILETLVEENYEVVAAVSQPDRPQGRKMLIKPTPVHEFCIEHAIECLQPERLKESLERLKEINPDLIVTCAYGQFIPESILNIPSKGCLNIHPSLLPKYRGGAPIHHAIWAGEKETGVCLMEMVKAMDAGRVFARRYLSIGDDETMEELNIRLMDESCTLIREALPEYLDGKLPGEPQDESKVVIGRNIAKEEEKITFSDEDINEVYNHARALINWPISYGVIEGKRVKFLKVRKDIRNVTEQPGMVLGFHDHAMEIACKGGVLRVLELQMEGKSRMNADAFANGTGKGLVGKIFE